MELEVKPLTFWSRIPLVLLIAMGIFSAIYFADYWFFSEQNRHWLWFPILSLGLFWGVYRSVANWLLYYFIHPEKMHKPSSHTHLGTVDVLITAMPGEPYAMFLDTLTKVQQMTYPHQTYLLDGGNNEDLKKLCFSLNIHHIDCRGIQGAKAGKINHCLRNYSQGEFVFIMDPDHRPKADMLERTLPYFENPKIGFVQVVQAYYNLHKSFVAEGAAEQTFGFYGPTLQALNGLGIATAIGANCVFRKAALDHIGGHAVHLAEDALTSMRIHAQGYQSVYLPYRGTDGLVPEDIASFFKQQYKWATGMFYILFREYPTLFKKWNWISKIHYWNAGTFYFGGLATFLTLILPIVLLFSKQYAVEFAIGDFLLHLFPYTLSTVLTYAYVQRFYTHTDEKRIPWRSLVLEKASWHILVMAFISGVLNRRVEYIPTPKEADQRPMPLLILPNLIVIFLSLSAILYTFISYPRIDVGTSLMIFFAILNIITLIPVSIVALFPSFNWRFSHA